MFVQRVGGGACSHSKSTSDFTGLRPLVQRNSWAISTFQHPSLNFAKRVVEALKSFCEGRRSLLAAGCLWPRNILRQEAPHPAVPASCMLYSQSRLNLLSGYTVEVYSDTQVANECIVLGVRAWVHPIPGDVRVMVASGVGLVVRAVSSCDFSTADSTRIRVMLQEHGSVMPRLDEDWLCASRIWLKWKARKSRRAFLRASPMPLSRSSIPTTTVFHFFDTHKLRCLAYPRIDFAVYCSALEHSLAALHLES